MATKTKECIWHKHVGKRRLPLSEFGTNAAYKKWGAKDGLSIYCKPCVIQQRMKQRIAISEARAARRAARIAAKAQPTVQDEPQQRVFFAIKDGARTQKQIERKAKVYTEQLGLALVNLILVEKKVISRVNETDEREYFVAA